MKGRWLCGLLAAVMLVSVLSGLPLRTNAVETMTSSEDMVNILKKMEGFHAKPYWDNTQWTVGYGTRCPSDKLEEYKANGIPEEEAEALLRKMLLSFENEVNNFAKKYNLTFKQHEFDALVSLTYNCGGGWLRDTSGILNQAIRSGAQGTDLIYAMSLYSKAHVDYVLIQRRLSESYMYLEGKYEAYNNKHDGTYPSSYRYVFLDGNGGEVHYAIHGYNGADLQPVRTSFSSIPVGVDGEGKPFVYTFAGWYTASVGGTKVETLDGSLPSATVLYAQWADPTGQIVELPKGEPADNIVITTEVKKNIRTGPGTFYPKAGDLASGATVTITETYTYNGSLWGKYDGGWITLTYTNYEDVLASLDNVWPKTATVTGSNVNVRNLPSTEGSEVKYQLNTGDSVVITEVQDGSGLRWGKLEDGNWICLSYVTFGDLEDTPAAKPTATGAVLLSGPTRTDYVQMQDFLDLQGTVVQITYSDGSISAQTLSNSQIKTYSNATLGETTVTANCSGFNVTFPVNIIKATVTFCNEDGTVLSQGQYAYGEVITPPEVPAKPADDAGEYEFVGWSPALTTCNGDETYTAVFRLIVVTEPETTLPEETSPGSDPSQPTQPSEPSEPTEPTMPEWPKTGTVVTQDSSRVNVRPGPGTSSGDPVYQLNTGDKVKIFEVKHDGTTYEWGRLEDGNWVCMDYVKLDAAPGTEPETIPGDMDGDEVVNEDDAIYLLRSIFLPEDYPVTGFADLNGDDVVNEDDAIYLLRHIFLPEDYPLTVK